MMMTREIAEELVESLKNHSGIISMVETKFIELLTSLEIDRNSKKFYIDLPDDDKYQQLLEDEESRKYHFLSIRRILINKNAVHNVSLIKKIWGSLISKIRWSSNVFVRNIRLNKKIAKFLAENKSQFSLLAKLQTYDYRNKKEVLFTRSQPILAVPNAKEDEIKIIEGWEKKNTFYEEEIGFLSFRYPRRISFKKYSACS